MTPFTIRRAELSDVQTLVDLRIAYLLETGQLVQDSEPAAMQAATRRYFMRKMPIGEYIGWVAVARPSVAAETRGLLRSKVIGTAGVFVYDRPPNSPVGGSEARLINVYTDPAWRGKGIANAMIEACIETARRNGVQRILVDDTPTGRRLYEAAGFTTINSIMELVWPA